MAWGERASDRFSAELVDKPASLGRWVGAIFETLTGSTADATPRYELRLTDKQSGEIVLRETYGSIAGDEALRLANERLEQMSVAEFCDTYSIEN